MGKLSALDYAKLRESKLKLGDEELTITEPDAHLFGRIIVSVQKDKVPNAEIVREAIATCVRKADGSAFSNEDVDTLAKSFRASSAIVGALTDLASREDDEGKNG